MLKTAFDSWIRDAEQKIASASDYPLIDYDEIHMHNELADCWMSDIDTDIEFFENCLVRRDSFAVRFVILNFLYRLLHFEGVEQEWVVKEFRSAAAQNLARFVFACRILKSSTTRRLSDGRSSTRVRYAIGIGQPLCLMS